MKLRPMNETESVATIDGLKQLGFQPATDPFNPIPCYAFDFGGFVLRCREVTDLIGETSIWFSGVISTPRTMAQVEFIVPREVDSVDQCAAIIAHKLDRSARKVFQPDPPVEWLAEGRRNKHLLPWVIARAKKELEDAPFLARPRCLVQHEWARHAIRTLSIYLEAMNPEAPIVFCFEDSVLRIICEGTDYAPDVIAMAAEGKDWPDQYAVRASRLKEFPKRFRGYFAEFSIWNGKLTIDEMKYELI